MHKEAELVIDLLVRNLCCHPYPNHSHGCPNYGKKKGRIRYEEGSFELSEPERNSLIAAAEPNTLKEVAQNIIDGRHGKMSVVPEPASGVDSDAAQRASRILDDVLEKYRATCQEHLAAYREAGGNEFWEDELTPEQFVGKIIEHLSGVAEDES